MEVGRVISNKEKKKSKPTDLQATESESLQTVGAIIKGSHGTLEPPPVHSHPHSAADATAAATGTRVPVHMQGLLPAERKVWL